MCNLGFKFPCLFCVQNLNTRYLELRDPQLRSPGRRTARLNLYERSPDCRHRCLYSQTQSTAMVWESTTVKIVSPGSFEPLRHANICTHALWRKCGTSPWILICLRTSEIQRREPDSGGKERSAGFCICLSTRSAGSSSGAHESQREFVLSRHLNKCKNIKRGCGKSGIQIHLQQTTGTYLLLMY